MRKTKRWIAMFAMLALGLGVFLSGCSDDDEDVVPTPAPVAQFSADNTSGPAPLTVQFTDSSTGSVTTRSWDFGDNTAISTEQNPLHIYTAAGTYDVALTVTGPGGSDTETKVGFITVGQAPTTGLEFTTENMVEVAYLGTDTADIFSKIGFVFSEIIGNLPAPPIPNGVLSASPLAASPLGPSGLCELATVDNVVWNDNDNNSLPTVGDTIEVFWEDCAIDNVTNLYGDPSGSGNPAVTFTFTDNVSVVPPIVVTGTLDLNILIVESGLSSTLKGTMPAIGSTDNQAVTINLGDVSGTAADAEVVERMGTGEIKFGCFDVQIIFDNVANPFDFSMSVRGVRRDQTPLGASIMQLGDYEEGLAPGSMSFVNGIPESGSLKLLSFDNRANSTVITGLASCYEDVTGTTSELVTADGSGLGHVDLFTDIVPADPWGGTPAATQDIDWLD